MTPAAKPPDAETLKEWAKPNYGVDLRINYLARTLLAANEKIERLRVAHADCCGCIKGVFCQEHGDIIKAVTRERDAWKLEADYHREQDRIHNCECIELGGKLKTARVERDEARKQLANMRKRYADGGNAALRDLIKRGDDFEREVAELRAELKDAHAACAEYGLQGATLREKIRMGDDAFNESDKLVDVAEARVAALEAALAKVTHLARYTFNKYPTGSDEKEHQIRVTDERHGSAYVDEDGSLRNWCAEHGGRCAFDALLGGKEDG